MASHQDCAASGSRGQFVELEDLVDAVLEAFRWVLVWSLQEVLASASTHH